MENDSDEVVVIYKETDVNIQEQNDVDEENVNVVNTEAVNEFLEGSILTATRSIRNDRNRASLDNILRFVKRQGINTDIKKLEQVTAGLVDCNKLVDKGKNGKESFYVVVVDDDDDAAVNKNNNINEYQEVLGKNSDEGVTKDNENFIDEKYATAVNENFNILLTERVTQELKRQTSFNVMKHLTESIMNDFKITVINELKEYIKSDLKETIISDDDDFKKNSHKRIKRKY